MFSSLYIGTQYQKNGVYNISGSKIKKLYWIDPYDLAFRIYASFIPPFGDKYKKIYVDFLGPTLALIFLNLILNQGNLWFTNKIPLSPFEFLLIYSLLMPIGCFLLIIIGKSDLTLVELISLLGYGLYGHLFTITLSFLCDRETNNAIFFLFMILFCGMSTVRLILILLKTIPRPASRLIICSFVSIVQFLSLMYLHFGYMHKTFVYGKKINI